MKTTDIPINSIDVTERRRENYGDIAGLAAGIDRIGLLVPILVDKSAPGRYRLVFGGRRLRAMQMLKWDTVPAFIRDQLTEAEFREIELEENENRLQLTEREKARRFSSSKRIVEQAKKVAEVISTTSEEKDKRGRKSTHGVPKEEIAKSLNTSVGNLVRAEQHVETAEAFPFMQGNTWRQSNVLAVRETLEVLPAEERESAVAVLGCAKILDPDLAVTLVENIGKKKPEERAEVYRLSQSEDPRDKSLALTKAAELPPMPDPRLGTLDQAVHFLIAATKPYPNDPLTPRIREVITEVRAIRSAVKVVSFDARRDAGITNGVGTGGAVQ
jgi:hypothetical protein